MRHSTDASGDRAYCRAALSSVSRTFAINIRVLSGSMADAVRIAYLLCRAADALEDSWPGEAGAVGRRFDVFLTAVSGDERAADHLARDASALAAGRQDLDLVAHLPSVWRAFRALSADDREIIGDGVGTLARGMRRYAVRSAERAAAGAAGGAYLDTESELHDYCWVVAGCVGVMLTHLFARRAKDRDETQAGRRLELAPAVGEALQLTNILLDWPVDVRRGRCYLPAEWLSEFGLAPDGLVDVSRPGVAAIVARLEHLARAALARVPDYLDTIPPRHVRYRLFCLWPALWALGSLRHARLDPEFPWGTRRPKLPRGELRRAALAALLAARDGRSLRRLYAASS